MAAKGDKEVTTASSLPQDSSSLAPPVVNLPQGAKKPRFGSPIGSKMDRRKAIQSRGSSSKGKGPKPSGTVNLPPLQCAFHVWKSESGGPPIIIVDDSDSEDLFCNAVVVEEGEDSLVLQGPDSQGAQGLAATIDAANFHNQAMMDKALEENKENVPLEDKGTTGMETRSKEHQDLQGASSPLATPLPQSLHHPAQLKIHSLPQPPLPQLLHYHSQEKEQKIRTWEEWGQEKKAIPLVPHHLFLCINFSQSKTYFVLSQSWASY
ncbi:hypothetical protein EYR36_007934 [Pleurotus pulmonarius]|nr:hypothetical protein EYR36_007934 [Pleurotus pulmonarius]